MNLKKSDKNKEITVVLSADDNYAAYLGVCIKSIIENTSPQNRYHLYILDGGISDYHKKLILRMKNSHVEIDFTNMAPYLKSYDKSLFSLSLHFTIATYYRFFLPQIFADKDKIIYLDCDTVILKDLAELYKTNIKNFYFAATRDTEIIRGGERLKEKYLDYFYKKLNLKNHKNYIQAGCLVCNIKKMREDNLTAQLIEKLKEVKTPKFVDQCIINATCEGMIKFIRQNWNFTWHLPFIDKEYKQYIPEPYLKRYLQAREDPYIIHFTGNGTKPWLNPALEKADVFWYYARMTPFYEEILYRNLKVKIEPPQIDFSPIKAALSLTTDKIKYWRYKLLSKITFGKKRKKYKRKRKELKDRLKMAKNFLKGK